MSQSSSVPPSVNRFMKFILRSPFHGLVSKSILLITFTGRKSGKTYTTPVSYSQQGNRVIIFTHANWWKNLSNHGPVTLQLRGKAVQGYAETISKDKASIAAGLSRHLQIVRGDARYYGVTFDEQGLPRAEEIEKAASSAVMICIQLS